MIPQVAFAVGRGNCEYLQEQEIVSQISALMELRPYISGIQNGAHANKAQAHRGAALKLLSNPQYRHPFYRVGFVMIGDGN
jgi:hypothetical protein